MIAASEGQISAAIHLPNDLPAPVVICCHGMFSSKDTPKYIALGNICSDAGIALVRFDFAGCGETSAPLGGDLISSRLRDLTEVTSYVLTQTWCNGSLGLFGSSLGGFISLLLTGSNPVRVAAIVSWAAPCDLERIVLPSRDLNAPWDYFPEGFGLGKPSNLKQILSSASHVLVIHGKHDEVVRWTEALEIYLSAREPKRLLMMEEAEHRFLDSRSRELALLASRNWFVKYLFA
jgi:dipeptidyl aminopeptidase/acylaminoacyl peptidase